MAHQDESKSFKSKNIPICSICDVVCMEHTFLPACSHPVCPKCLAMANLHTSKTKFRCRTCAETEKQKASGGNGVRTTERKLGSRRSSRHDRPVLQSLQIDINTAQSLGINDSDTKIESIRAAVWSFDKHEPYPMEQKDLQDPAEVAEEAFEPPQLNTVQHANKPRRNSLPAVMMTPGLSTPRRNSLPSVIIVPGLMGLSLEEDSTRTLAENVEKIREALTLATKHRHCATCLQAKTSTVPQLKCMDCDTSFCDKCSEEHKSTPAYTSHIMVPVERPKRNSVVSMGRAQRPLCLTHQGGELGMYCRNCETLLCRECVVDQHLDCPGIVPAGDYATEEREAVQLSRVRYRQVLSFFSEQQQEADNTMEALTEKKKTLQGEIRKYFSTLIKSCMDVEGTLLEELEMSVTDHTDLLTRQSSAWLTLQECMQQLLDVTDVLHFLPNADFLPLSVASKASLSQALREGEMLAAEAPAHMTVNLSLMPALQQSVVNCVQEIGTTALTVTTHNTIILRKMTSTSYSSPEDSGDPQITSMVLLTQTALLAADFNNSSLKLFRREEKGETWRLVETLPLKWRPYSITQLLQKGAEINMDTSEEDSLSTRSENSNDSDFTAEEEEEEGNIRNSSQQQSPVCSDDEEMKGSEATVEEIQVAVTSPSSGCFIISVPLTGEKKMEVVRAITEEKGCWGITALDEKTLAVVAVELGQSFISTIDTENNTWWKLPLDSTVTPPLLQSPRQILAISPSSLVICDKGQRAVFHVSTEGAMLFTYIGHMNHQLLHPEDVCRDSYGFLYITDSQNSAITMLNKKGALYRKTSSLQSDLNCPYAVCVDKNGCLYVANEGGKVLTVYDIIHAG